MTSTTRRYGAIAKISHWLSAALILVMLPLGLLMTRLAEGALQTALYQAHVGIGLMVLLLTLARILWRLFEPTPTPPAGLSKGRQLLFQTIHVLQYVALVALLASGAGILFLSGLGLSPAAVAPQAIADNLPVVQVHSALAYIFSGLLVAHVVGLFEYQISGKGNALARMVTS